MESSPKDSADASEMPAVDASLPAPTTSIILTPEEFAEDLDKRLGRANGNVYSRKPGIEGVHDGQIMIRLKKKRFIVIDYGFVPTEADIQVAAVSMHIATPPGAGKQKCVTPECNKVGVPVLLYDSEPAEPASLYLRSGMCFTCQRVLNEKRRTQRKRKSDGATHGVIAGGSMAAGSPHGAYSMEVAPKKFKVNGEAIELNPDAIIINGPIEGTKHHGSGYEFNEIGLDLQGIVQELSNDTNQLVGLKTSDETATAENSVPLGNLPTSHHEVTALYEKAFLSMSKGIFLLTQWKASWDAASSSSKIVDSAALDDAVASAAAVAAASAVNSAETTNMISLLVAAESKGEKNGDEGEKKPDEDDKEGGQASGEAPAGDGGGTAEV